MSNLSTSLGDDFYEWVNSNSIKKKFFKGQCLVKGGEEIEYLYYSDKVQGEYQIYDKGNKLVKLEKLESLELSSFDSLLTLSPPIANIVSTSDRMFIQIEAQKFIKYIESSNSIENNFLVNYAKILSRKIQLRNDLLSKRQKEKIVELKKILLFFGDLDELDIAWLQKVGKHLTFKNNQIVIEENKNVPFIYIILSGLTNIFISRGGKNINVGLASKGEILGEMSLLLSKGEHDLATASVVAVENADVLAIDKKLLRQKLMQDKGFAFRFYLSITRMLSFRLRDQLISSGLGIRSNNLDIDNDELDFEILSKLTSAGNKFDSFCRRYY